MVAPLPLPILIPVLPTILPKHPLKPFLHRIRNTEIIEQPLIAMTSIVPKLLLPLTPAALLISKTGSRVPTAPCRHPRLTELSWGNADALPLCFGERLCASDAEARVLRVLAVVCACRGHGGALCEARHDLAGKGGGSGTSLGVKSGSSMIVVVVDVGVALGLVLGRAESGVQGSGVDGLIVVVSHRQCSC
jgi:hypothetical protein